MRAVKKNTVCAEEPGNEASDHPLKPLFIMHPKLSPYYMVDQNIYVVEVM